MKDSITIYTLPTCPKCKVLKQKLDAAGVKYNECQDIEVMQDKGIRSAPALGIVPVGETEEKIIFDFGKINATVNVIIEGVSKK